VKYFSLSDSTGDGEINKYIHPTARSFGIGLGGKCENARSTQRIKIHAT